jgi:hypothetical protein
MTKVITVRHNKTLKLVNTLLLELSKEEDFEQIQNFQILVEQMDFYIRKKGAQPVGPLIQKLTTGIDESGEPKRIISFIRQSDTFIHHVEHPYRMESIIKVSDCLYTRFVGEEDDLRFAYNKIQLAGYEEEISLTDETYTVFVDSNEDDGTMTADIFVPKK